MADISRDDIRTKGATKPEPAQNFAPPVSEVFAQRRTWDDLLKTKALKLPDRSQQPKAPTSG